MEVMCVLGGQKTNKEMLHDYKLVKEIFIRYNTNLPSSAAVEWMFNFSNLLNASRKHAMSDNLFEELVF